MSCQDTFFIFKINSELRCQGYENKKWKLATLHCISYSCHPAGQCGTKQEKNMILVEIFLPVNASTVYYVSSATKCWLYWRLVFDILLNIHLSTLWLVQLEFYWFSNKNFIFYISFFGFPFLFFLEGNKKFNKLICTCLLFLF